MTQRPNQTPQRGVRGFELDLHVAFMQPLPEAQARAVLLALDSFQVELYRPHPAATGAARPAETSPSAPNIPSARLTAPLRDPDAVRVGLATLLAGQARYLEVGVRGFLRSSTGQTEWMPWRRTQVLPRTAVQDVTFEQGVKYVLE